MANRYWVGGTASWDATAGAKWALTSGGAGGALVPTSSDDVFLDAAIGAATITIAASNCKSLDCTGFAGTLTGAGSALSAYGSVTLGAAMTISGTVSLNLYAASGSWTVTSAGKAWSNAATFGPTAGSTATWSLQDDFECTSAVFGFRIISGTCNTNGVTVTAKRLQASTGTMPCVLNLAASLFILNDVAQGSAALPINFTNTNFTLNAGTSTLRVMASASGARTIQFSLSGRALNNVELLSAAGTHVYSFLTDATVNQLKSFKTNAYSILNTAGTTLTVADWQCDGTAGNLVTLGSSSASLCTFAKSGGGTVTVDYANISWSTASPGSTWTATNSTDSGNNTGWSFSAASVQNNLFFGGNF